MKNQSVLTISFVLIFFIYALTLPIEQYIVFGEENSTNSISERIILPYTIQKTTTIAVQQDGESDENEPITDLPVIDSPCKSACPPNYKMCIYTCL
ncbi:MAG TPA: hypothetical protein VF222_04840 [Nitrososphaeraceae archaeon]